MDEDKNFDGLSPAIDRIKQQAKQIEENAKILREPFTRLIEEQNKLRENMMSALNASEEYRNELIRSMAVRDFAITMLDSVIVESRNDITAKTLQEMLKRNNERDAKLFANEAKRDARERKNSWVFVWTFIAAVIAALTGLFPLLQWFYSKLC